MLTDVPEINQTQLQDVFRYTIDNGANTLILGPSGGGKTEMCFQIIEEKKCHPIYINMAVLERTDFQGMPAISEDKKSVSYATPKFLPFTDIKLTDKRDAYKKLASWVKVQTTDNKSFKKEEILSLLNDEIKNLDDIEEVELLKSASNYLSLREFDSLKSQINKSSAKEQDSVPIVILFDEVDKAISEVLQTLLEFLQFRSINGRKLDIKACFLTANLPDEHAHTNQISHAITKRCMTFKLDVQFELWKSWAIKNGISPLIVEFLTQYSNLLYKTAQDETAYAMPSPRTWVAANKIIKYYENNNVSKLSDELQLKLISGCIGENTAIQFNNWLNHYHKLDPFINELMEKGTFPTVTEPAMTTQDIFICALSACSKIEAALRPDNKDTIEKYVKHTFLWLETLQSDIQIGSIRMVFGGNFDNSKGQEGLIMKYKLSEIPEFSRVFIDIHKKINEWEKLNAARSEKPSDQ